MVHPPWTENVQAIRAWQRTSCVGHAGLRGSEGAWMSWSNSVSDRGECGGREQAPQMRLKLIRRGAARVTVRRGLAFATHHLVLEKPPLSWTELARRTWREVVEDDVFGLAAQLSYYFFLALFPAILFLLAVASFFPLSNVTDDVGRANVSPIATRRTFHHGRPSSMS
jgi:hypothetical protein